MVRLPSEAEWEYAARNLGQFFKFSWADVSTATCQNINFVESRIPGCDLNSTKKVCSYSTSLSPLRNPPQNMDSPQGICDLNGNIAEWVEDAYLISYQGVPTDGSANQPAPNSNNLQKVYRGGSWRHTLSATTSLVRSAYNRSSQANFLGMRVASTCVSDSPVEICGDLIDNNCNGELNESCL